MTSNKLSLLVIISLVTFLGRGSVFAIKADEIIRRVDANMTSSTSYKESRMVIHIDNEVREKSMFSYSRGLDTAFSQFTSPARDKGVKYLKIADNMWMYLPDVDKIVKISGAMLRQSMMGSDFSYEDVLDSSKLLTKYTATRISEEVITNTQPRSCYVVDLTAKVKEVTYNRRLMWVDKKTFIPLKEELFALSGMKLKVLLMDEIKNYNGRYYPTYMAMSNLLRQNSKTEIFIDKVRFNQEVNSNIFTVGNLTK